MCSGFSFHALLRSEIEFRQHLPVVLQIHVPTGRLCIRRTTGRYCWNSVSDWSRPWKLTPSAHLRAVQKTWTIRNRYGYWYAKICIFLTVSLSNGRHLTGLRGDTWPGQRKSGYTLGGGEVRLAGPWRVGAVARRRGAGRPGDTGVLRLGSCKKKERSKITSTQKFGSISPERWGFQTWKKTTARWPTTTYISRNHMQLNYQLLLL